ncbi:uncharacterized protein LOC130985584 isoform X9 [Salvia miltiorrhiza]|uniref:uncharacterized protein LOC130985584 isoform X9 n=1 Tax=Salvia miltiorrhiza TaxID=226208 RepID=UPI0025ABDFF4|nr:uncharacterized protein LOC130985584 isoform X9 [Salvia miltiorrhiza]XP_057764628.1 uncharacterized protein LOC130985584 isoform X9 [Salvia miltiorrhiza]XP_057764629.1 uncharacterized protein LOC130985584 isoform X9 [Salvia miltiorrhiza]
MTSRPTTRNLQLSPLRRPPPSPSPPRSAVILATQPWTLDLFELCSRMLDLFKESLLLRLSNRPVQAHSRGEWVSCSVGANFTPHIITVNA